MSDHKPVSPEQYKLIFEDNRVGAAILEDLLFIHARPAPKAGGIDRVLDMAKAEGRRDVLDFIVNRINQAHGVRSYGEVIELDEEQ